MRTTARFKTIKRLAVAILSSAPVGRLIGMAYRNRIPSRGSVISTDHPLISPQTKALVYWGIYESAEARFVGRYLRSDLDTVELGASLGVIGSLIAARLDPARRLVCVEANPGLQDILSQNVLANSGGATVNFVSGAIDYSGGPSVKLDLGDSSFSASTTKSGADSVEVSAVRLDDVLVRHGIVSEYQLVMDIEGAEHALLLNEYEVLKRCRSMIVELHETRTPHRVVSVEDLLTLATEMHGFRLSDRYGPVCYLERP
jgi:FkbM family methyltransferase